MHVTFYKISAKKTTRIYSESQH